MNNKLKNYIFQLPLVGIFFVLSSLYFHYEIYRAQDYWALNSIPLKFFGALVAFILVYYWAPGGNVNYYFMSHRKTKDEKKLNSLIKKYRSTNLLVVSLFIIIAMDVKVGLPKYLGRDYFNFTDINGYVFFFLTSFFLATPLFEGIKYITAWWNIKRNWKKEFGTR